MKKFTFFIPFLFLFLTTQAQVTITESNVLAPLTIGNTITTYQDTLVGMVDIGAPGQSSWDFSGQTSKFEFETTMIDPSTSPAASTFSGATHASHAQPTFAGVTSDIWTHEIVSGGTYGDLGTYSTTTAFGFTTETTVEVNPPDVFMPLPLNYQDTWNSTTVRTVSTVTAGFPGQTTDVDYNTTRTADAYGSLVMPDGSVESVLRVKVVSEITTNAGGIPQTQTTVGYRFYSPSGSFVSINLADPNAPDNGSVEVSDMTWYYGSGSTGVEEIDNVANDFSLAQNYPNPFNPTTNIQYSIPKASNVSLKVYDVLGKEVATLVNKELSAGVYNSTFDGSNLASGIYFYSLRAGNFIATKKLMLVK